MKHNFVVSLFGSFVGVGLLLILFSTTGSVGARGADVRSDTARINEVGAATPLTSTFTYQGQLKSSGNPITATCDFQFGLWDSLSGGAQIGITQTLTAVSVNAGYFTALLNNGNPFGINAFNGNQRWLAITVRCPAGSGGYTAFNQRQPLTAVPYASYSAAPWVTSGSNLTYNAGNVGIGTTNPTSKLEIAAQDGLAITGYQPFITLRDANANNARTIIQNGGGSILFYPQSFIGGNPAMILNNNAGNVGLGTTTPAHRLSIIGGPLWTSNSWSGALELSNGGAIGWQANSGGQRFGIGQSSLGLYFFRTASNPGTTASPANYDLTIDNTGKVNVGSTAISPIATLNVHGANTNADSPAFRVENSVGSPILRADNDGVIWIGKLYSGGGGTHVCFNGSKLSACASAAEYVPSIDGGAGFPEAADLVSLALMNKNPYGDEHAPFVVTKSNKPCDVNLLGFIVNPASGADGKKFNDHYLPLAIYGYFPAKVTLENGAIKRGDPLTSSSKPGYGMKATGACKIIGYALEDADEEGLIQVFANHGESTSPAVTTLQAQVQVLQDQNTSLEARLMALEKAMSGQPPAQSVFASTDIGRSK